ncbi:MAG: heavy-metal-associated domain-containing protein [Gemmatimonadota bacterium]|nr:heavy-metal-associated domain-containing protein [Gemmatimonadota bacterium]
MLLKSSIFMLLGSTLVGGFAVCELCQPPPTAMARLTLPAGDSPSHAPVANTLSQVTLRVEGMTCGGCTLATRKVLLRLPGVERADVSYERRQAVVTYDPAKVTPAQMIAAVKTLNYTATVVAVPHAAPTGAAADGGRRRDSAHTS